MSFELLASRQNPDGGWPYLRGNSWTEPTVYAVMALLAGGQAAAASRGLRWLAATQRSDGGWAPQPVVDQSTWVTGLLALLPVGEAVSPASHAGAIRWLMGTVGHESTVEYRVREWLLGNSIPTDQEFAGWPWVPGSAAWVGPTSIALLALGKETRRRPSSAIHARIATGRKFLLCRMCQGGGWNHGSARPLGYDSDPYPETTGMALAALRGEAGPEVGEALGVAHRFLEECRSADAFNWLRLGVWAHGGLPAGFTPPAGLACRTVPELSLRLLLEQGDAAHRFFWEEA
jgi:Prenyltransferase and squalene oxidase repeat